MTIEHKDIRMCWSNDENWIRISTYSSLDSTMKMKEVLENQNIVEKLKREKHLWEEPMDSSFSNEIRRSVLRTLTEILNSTSPNSKSVVGKI